MAYSHPRVRRRGVAIQHTALVADDPTDRDDATNSARFCVSSAITPGRGRRLERQLVAFDGEH
jgi:hypothetical protein